MSLLNRLAVLIAGCFIAFSCSNPLEKSVMEPLEAKEIDRVARKDKTFLATYSVVEDKWNHIHTPEDSSRWQSITYDRLHTYLTTIESAQLNSPLVIQLREKWEKSYNSHRVTADTIIKTWKNYLQSNSTDSLVTVSYEGIELERFRNSRKEIDTLLKAKISIKPLKQVIDSISVQYAFINLNDTIQPADSSFTPNVIEVKKRINQIHNLKVFPDLDKETKRMLIAKDSSVAFSAVVTNLYCSGKSFCKDSLMKEMPKSVQAYIQAESRTDTLSPVFDQNFYIENIIKELVDKSFMSQSAFIKLNAEDYYKEIDSLVFNFLNYNSLQ
ncbi:MAG: hypothetical protein J6Q34_05265 [Bacteroidales bacterium]|nr:hypothetical protein [Bacteroidales bacterium]